MKNTRMNYTEIEEIIENRLEAMNAFFDVADWEIAEIRDQIYRENGWDGDPDAEEDEEDDDEDWRIWTIADELREIGMSERDFL